MTLSLPSLGWDEEFDTAYRDHERPDQWPARVSQAESGVCQLLAADGAGRASVAGPLLAAAAANPCALPCLGDWVVVRGWPDGRATIEAVLPRRNTLHLAGSGTPPARVANLDLVAVLTPAGSPPDAVTVDRLCTSGVIGHPPRIVVLATPAELRALAGVGRTVGVVGASAVARAALCELTGTAVLGAGALFPLPGGGAVVAVDLAGAVAAPAAIFGRAGSRPVLRRRA
jgi:ribosome biogenesis GTPase